MVWDACSDSQRSINHESHNTKNTVKNALLYPIYLRFFLSKIFLKKDAGCGVNKMFKLSQSDVLKLSSIGT